MATLNLSKLYNPWTSGGAADLAGGLNPLPTAAASARAQPATAMASSGDVFKHTPMRSPLGGPDVPAGPSTQGSFIDAMGRRVATPVIATSLTGAEQDQALQRQLELNRELQRNALTQPILQASDPNSFATQGMPASYWKAQTDLAVGQVQNQYAALRADLQRKRQAGSLLQADYDLLMTQLAREEAGALSGARSKLKNTALDFAAKQAQERAQSLLGLYSAIPRDRFPVQPEKPMHSISGRGREDPYSPEAIATTMRKQGYTSWNAVPYPTRQAIAEKSGGRIAVGNIPAGGSSLYDASGVGVNY